MLSPPGKLVTSCWNDVSPPTVLALLGVRDPRLGDSLVIERLRGADNCCRLDDRRVWLEVWSAGLAVPL